MNLKGVFVVVSAIVRGKSLVISAFCPSDQSVSELVLGVPEVQRILKDNPELLSRAGGKMCRAIVSKVDFYEDGDRVLLVDETKNSKVATTEQAKEGAEDRGSKATLRESDAGWAHIVARPSQRRGIRSRKQFQRK